MELYQILLEGLHYRNVSFTMYEDHSDFTLAVNRLMKKETCFFQGVATYVYSAPTDITTPYNGYTVHQITIRDTSIEDDLTLIPKDHFIFMETL